MPFKIALVCSDTAVRDRIGEILRVGGLLVEMPSGASAASLLDGNAEGYDLVLADRDAMGMLREDRLFNASLLACGYLALETGSTRRDIIPPYLLHADMSAEELVARVNSAIYQNLNRRKNGRYKMELPVEYECLGEQHRSVMLDLSETGMFITTLSPPPIGAAIHLHFPLPDAPIEIAASGHVVFRIECNLDQRIIAHPSRNDASIIAQPGFGITFDHIETADRDHIADFLLRRQ